MKKGNITRQHLESLLQQTITIMQNPLYSQEPKNYEVIASILKTASFLKQKVENIATPHDFIEIAKYHMTHEVHSYGSLVLRENEYSDKICIVLKGNLDKLEPLANTWTYERPTLMRSETKVPTFSEFSRDMPQLKRRFEPSLTSYGMPNAEAQARNDFRMRRLNTRDLSDLSSSISPRRGGIKVHLGNSLIDRDMTKEQSPDENEELEHDKARASPNERAKGLNRAKTIFNFVSRPLIRSNTYVREVTVFDGDENAFETEPKEDEMQEDQEINATLEEDVKNMQENPQDWKGFIKYVASKNSDSQDILYTAGNIIRVQKTGKYVPGNSFGENLCKPRQPKETYSVVASSEEVHLLVLTKENYQLVMNQIRKQIQEKVFFFTDSVPSLDKVLINKFASYFSRKQYKKGEIIYTQNDPVKSLYILQTGDIRLIKEIEQNNFQKTISPGANSFLNTTRRQEKVELQIASIMSHQFFGEELILSKDRREHTAVAATGLNIVYFMEKAQYRAIPKVFEDFLTMLKEQTQNKFEWRQKRAQELLGQKQSNRSPRPMLEVTSSPDLFRTQIFGSNSSLDREKVRGSPMKMNINSSSLEVLHDISPTEVPNRPQKAMPTVVTMDKTSEIYRTKFSRKLTHLKGEERSHGIIKKRPENNMSGGRGDSNSKTNSGIPEYNIMKELESPKKYPQTLPTLSLGLNNVKTSETTRNYQLSIRNLMLPLSDRADSKERASYIAIASSLDSVQDAIASSPHLAVKSRPKRPTETNEEAASLYGLVPTKSDGCPTLAQIVKMNAKKDPREMNFDGIANARPHLFMKIQAKKKEQSLLLKNSKGH